MESWGWSGKGGVEGYLASVDDLSDAGDVFWVCHGAGFVVLRRDEQGALFVCGEVVDRQSVVLSGAGGKVLAPFDRGRFAEGLGVESGN